MTTECNVAQLLLQLYYQCKTCLMLIYCQLSQPSSDIQVVQHVGCLVYVVTYHTKVLCSVPCACHSPLHAFDQHKLKVYSSLLLSTTCFQAKTINQSIIFQSIDHCNRLLQLQNLS